MNENGVLERTELDIHTFHRSSRRCKFCWEELSSRAAGNFCDSFCRSHYVSGWRIPSPDEIQTRAAAIRAAWSELETHRRSAGQAPTERVSSWRPPQVAQSALTDRRAIYDAET